MIIAKISKFDYALLNDRLQGESPVEQIMATFLFFVEKQNLPSSRISAKVGYP